MLDVADDALLAGGQATRVRIEVGACAELQTSFLSHVVLALFAVGDVYVSLLQKEALTLWQVYSWDYWS